MLCPNLLEGDYISSEHVIAQAIGGRKEVTGFICRRCNSSKGRTWDAELARQFLWFSSVAGVKRDRGGRHPDVKVQTDDGQKWKLQADGVLVPDGHTVAIDTIGNQTKISIRAGDKKTTKNLLRKVARDFPSLDPDAAMNEASDAETYLDRPLGMTLQFGGPLLGRSIVKSALALLSEVEVSTACCQHALTYLLDEHAPPPFGFCFYADLVQDRPLDHLFHCVSVIGQPEQQRVMAYVELFNMARFLVHVGDGYVGEPFHRTYAIEPVSGAEVNLTVDFARAEDQLHEILQSSGEPQDKLVEAVAGCLEIVMPINESRARQRALEQATQETMKALGMAPTTERVPPELIERFAALFTQELHPYLEAWVKQRSSRT